MSINSNYKDLGHFHELLLNLTLAITTAQTTKEALDLALKRIAQSLGFKFGEAWSVMGDVLVLTSFYPAFEENSSGFKQAAHQLRFKKGEGIPGKVWQIKNSIWYDNLANLDSFPRRNEAIKAGLNTGIAIPIPLEGEVIGVVCFYLEDNILEDQELLRFLTAIAGQLGVVSKQKMIEEKLRRSEMRYRSMIEAAPDSVLTLNENGHIEDINKYTTVQFGYEQGEIGQRPWHVLFTGNKKAIEEIREKIAKKEIIRSMKLTGLKKDGTTFPAEITIAPVEIKDEIFYNCMIHDITQEKETEGLRSRLLSIIEHSDDAIFTKDLEGRVITWNKGSEKVTGYKASEMLGRLAIDLLAPEYRQDGERIIRIACSGKRLKHFETRIIHKDGHPVDVSLSVSPLYDDSNKVAGISLIARDITEQKEAETLRSKIASIVENSDDAIISRTLDGKIITWNPASERIFGYKASEMIGNDKTLLYSPGREREEWELLEKIKKGERIRNFESVRVRKDGTVIDVSLTISPIKTNDGKIIGASTIARDITDKIKIEAERKAILENVQAGIIACDRNGVLTFFNDVSRKMHGIPEKSIGPDEWARYYKMYHSDGKTPLKKEEFPLYRALKEGSVKNAELVIRSNDGVETYVVVSGQALYDKSGQTIGAVVAMHDLSYRKNMEEQLRVSEEKYRQVLNNIREVVFQTDAEGRWTLLNPAWTEITGYSVEESYGRPFFEFVHPDDREVNMQLFLPLVNGEIDTYMHEMRYTTYSGNYKWIEVTARTTRNSENKVIGTIGSLRDITQKHEAEEKIRSKNYELEQMNEELKKQIEERRFFEAELERSYAELERRVKERTKELSLSEKRFRLMGDMIPHIVWTAKPDGSIDYYNQKLDDYTGSSFDKTTGWGWKHILHPDDLRGTEESWNHALETGEAYEAEYRLRRSDGQYRWFLARALPLRDESGRILKWFGSATDIHDQKILDEKKDEFIGIASHELKTPLTSIKAYMQLLQTMVPEGSTLKNYVIKTNGFVNKLNDLISELLDVSKIQAGKLQFNTEPIDMAEMVREAVESVQHSTTTHKIIIEGELPHLKVTGDKMRLEQVLINFLTNAVKYSPQAGKVIVSVREEEDRITTAVKDFGMGIPPENQKRIFDRFYRVEGLSPHISGLGIGLYIAAEIVRRHKGKVWVESEVGKGSTFFFCLPVSHEDKDNGAKA